MATLQPLLYEQAKPDPSLVKEVTMGPFKVKVDDGLNIRKVCALCHRPAFLADGLFAGRLPMHVHLARDLSQQARH